MKVFILLSRIPYPLEKGDKLRAYHQLKELAKHHEIFLCCLSSSKMDHQAIQHLKGIVQHVEVVRLKRWRQIVQLLSGLVVDLPFQVLFFKQRPAVKEVQILLNNFKPDHILCQMIRTSEYVKSHFNCRKTLDFQDALSAGYERRIETTSFWKRPLFYEETARLKRYEQVVFDYFDWHWIISDQDRKRINHALRESILLVKNGVDTNYFIPDDSPKTFDLVFAGNMGYAPNVECVKRIVLEIWPLIVAKRPHVNLVIAGAEPTSEVMQLAKKYDNIVVTGWLDDIRTAYRSARILFAPMTIGSGLQNKILEAMSSELPCITSPLVLGGIGQYNNTPLMICSSNEDFAEAAIELLDNSAKMFEIGKSSREFVIQHFGWSTSMDHWLEKIKE